MTADPIQQAIVRAAQQVSEKLRRMEWQPIETAPKGRLALFWIVAKSADETYVDTDGKSIVANIGGFISLCNFGYWSSLVKATHWMPLPEPPK